MQSVHRELHHDVATSVIEMQGAGNPENDPVENDLGFVLFCFSCYVGGMNAERLSKEFRASTSLTPNIPDQEVALCLK
jgi:hypothetical protein